MASITLRPTGYSGGSNWTNIANAYDNSTSTYAYAVATSSNYTSRTLTLNFDTSSIPSGATINSATLTVRAANSNSNTSRRYTPYVDINGNSSNRVLQTQLTSTSATNLTADVASYMSSLSNIMISPRYADTSNSSYQLRIYEVYIDVDYTEPVTQYTVTFKDWDDTTLKTQTVNSGASATAPSDPTRAGYTFTGWDKTFTNVTSDLTVTAQYTQNSSGGGGTVSGDSMAPFTITRATCVDYDIYDEQNDGYFIDSSGNYITSNVASTLETILKSKDSNYLSCDLYDEYDSALYQAFIDLEFDISAYSNISKAELTLTLKCPSANGEHGYFIVTIGKDSNRFTRQPDIQQTSFTDVTYDVTQYLSYASNGKLVVTLDLEGESPFARITSSAASYYVDYVGLKITGDSSGGDGSTRSVTIKPRSGSGSWTNLELAYDSSTTTQANATGGVSRTTYQNKVATFTFDTSTIPSNANVTVAAIAVTASTNTNNAVTMYVDVNGDSSKRIINKSLITNSQIYPGTILNSVSSVHDLETITVTGYTTSTTALAFYIQDVRLTVEYTEGGGGSTPATKNICIGGSVIQELYMGSQSIIEAYIGDILLYSKSSGGTDTPVDPPSGGGEGGDMLEGLTWNSGTGTVRTGFTPNNQGWIDTIHMPMSGGEWSKALYIDVDIDISKCEVGVLEPIISVGTDITSGSTSCFHVYFNKTADTKGVIHTVAKYGTKTTESDTLSVTINSRKVRIAFDSDYGYETGKVEDSSLAWDTNFNTAISQCCLTHTPIYVGLASGEYSDAITYEISVATYDY